MHRRRDSTVFSPSGYLASAGWNLDTALGIWRHTAAASIDYSDGDVAEESVIAAIRAARDRSLASEEFPPPGADWPLEYHLSPVRANLLRPLPITRGARVLELGAGCGALTRALTETGADVVAIEGSPRRAAAAAARCHGLGNVAVACGDARSISLPGAFDWVLVVGVLEYVRRGATGTVRPEIDFLQRARNWTATDGALLLAIENRLGMKYFAGCGEDHVGRPFFGVEDLYGSEGPATYGRAELDDLLASVGFRSREFLFPFPDYKLPEVILRDPGTHSHSIDVAALAGGTFSRDYAGARTRSFSESLAWRTAVRNGLLPDLANSFLVIASPASKLPPARCPDSQVLAWAFSSWRRPMHRVETRFLRTLDGVDVEKRPLHPQCGEGANIDRSKSSFARRNLVERYVRGQPLREAISRALARHDGIAIVDDLVDRWVGALLSSKLGEGADATTTLLPATHVDAIPANALLVADGSVTFFDLEWVASNPVSLAWVVLRGFLGLAWSLDDVGDWRNRSVLEIARAALARHGLPLGDVAVATATGEDERLLREVLGVGDSFPFPLSIATVSAPIAPRVELMMDVLQRLKQASARHASMMHEHAAKQRELDEVRSDRDAMSGEVAQLRHLWKDEQLRHTQAIRHIHESEARSHEKGMQLAVAHDQIANLNASLAAARARIDAQVAELSALHQERATFGGKLGRFVTRQRNRWLPVDSRRGRAATFAAQFIESMAAEGPVSTLRRTSRFAHRVLVFARASSPEGAPDKTDIAAIPGDRTAAPPELAQWISANEPDDAGLDLQRIQAEAWRLKPVLSVILPVFRVPAAILNATLVSLQRQTYGNWEACIACADGPESENWQLLDMRAREDGRLRPFLLERNLGISGNSNAALSAAQGEFVALLDHDDELSPSAFFDVVKRLNEQPDLDFVYTDKDSIDAAGRHRQHALFKPEWSPEMLHSVNYLTHLNVMRRSLVQAIGGWRSETDGAQDWDLFFRLTERTSRIARVTGLHYHWRIVPTSTATGLAAKPYAAAAQLRCQRDRLERLGWSATAEPHDECGFRVIWTPPLAPNVEVIVHGRNELLRDCLDTLRFAQLSDVAVIRVLATLETPDYDAIVRDFSGIWGNRVQFERSRKPLAARLLEAGRYVGPDVVVLVDGRVRLVSTTAVEEVARWVGGADSIAWAAGVALARGDVVREAGRVVSVEGSSAPLFRDSPLRSWGWFGGALWHRNASAASPFLFALRRADLAGLDGDNEVPFAVWWTRACMRLRGARRRGLITPHARAWLDTELEDDPVVFDDGFGADPYFHPSFRGVSPLRLVP